MMDRGLIFLHSAQSVINLVRTAEEDLSWSTVVPVELRRGVG
jgi:hypothetical protein